MAVCAYAQGGRTTPFGSSMTRAMGWLGKAGLAARWDDGGEKVLTVGGCVSTVRLIHAFNEIL